MIRKTIKRWFSKTNITKIVSKRGKRKVYRLREHRIPVDQINKYALEVCRVLQDKGYQAYIVGGAVRDLLLKLSPKDFDIATDATPEQVKCLFRRAFIIGKRFRIVHVIFRSGLQREVIEVSTFRANVHRSEAHCIQDKARHSRKYLQDIHHAVDSSGRILRDNVWGTQDEDAMRRDFTLNALYYDPIKQVVVDYHGGMTDIKNRRLRMIGNIEQRYHEDPVRIIRAIRFAAKLGFDYTPETLEPLRRLQHLLIEVPPNRMFDEVLKLLQTGHALKSLKQLRKLDLQQSLHPLLGLVMQRADQPLAIAILRDNDERVAKGQSLNPSFLLAGILWPDVEIAWKEHQVTIQQSPLEALQIAMDSVFNTHIQSPISGRNKLGVDMREIWVLQTRFEKRSGKYPYRFITQPRFRAALHFLSLRAQVGMVDRHLVEWWETFYLADTSRQKQMLQALGSTKNKIRRKRRNKTTQIKSTNQTNPEINTQQISTTQCKQKGEN
jgi:poly(A) polymerase